MTKSRRLQTIRTEAAENGNYKIGWNRYPRPQLKRKEYLILSDNWMLDGQPIRVPFPPQSVLAEYEGKVGSQLIYETVFQIPKSFTKDRILLHFGAVDEVAEVWINDCFVGRHEGGYLPFCLDITEKVNRKSANGITVKVRDDLSGRYPYGKQRKKRGGMWYTPVSGIWQTVWLENVPKQYIENIALKPSRQSIMIQVEGQIDSFKAVVTLHNGEKLEQQFETREGVICLAEHVCADGSNYQPRLWTTEDPYLYMMRIITESDEIETYFALRTVEICKVGGVNRVCLNGKPVFLHGVLDQGYFSDGIYLPAEPEEYERDILRMKELGFNMLRKHIKVEPECFYYYCDKLGMLVLQDMVNNGKYSFLRDTVFPTLGKKRRSDNVRGQEERKHIFIQHMEQTIKHLFNHPCIVAYTIFNEGWGQFDSDKLYNLVKTLDETRLVDSTSGWYWQEKSDFDSEHIYFKIKDLEVRERPLLVSECGGYSRMIEGHRFNMKKSYGYGSADSEEGLTEKIMEMYQKMILPGIQKGVCGCVYTQLSDVEDEINGLYTYDRKVCKVNKNKLSQISEEINQKMKGKL